MKIMKKESKLERRMKSDNIKDAILMNVVAPAIAFLGIPAVAIGIGAGYALFTDPSKIGEYSLTGLAIGGACEALFIIGSVIYGACDPDMNNL